MNSIFSFFAAILILESCDFIVGGNDEFLSLLITDKWNYCITNSTTALIYFTSRDQMKVEQSVVIPPSSYNNDFESSRNDFSGWKKVDSLNFESFPILDLRWERFPVQKLEYISYSTLQFKMISEIRSSEKFSVTLSVKCSEAHFLLCDGEKVETSNCYWLILQGWGGKYTIIRKCEEKQIPVSNQKYPKAPCKTALRNISHIDSKDFPTFLNQNEWNHVTIEKNGRNFYLKSLKNGEMRTIFHYLDQGEMFNIKYLIGHRKSEEAIYKLHQTSYMRTDSSSDTLKLNYPLTLNSGMMCLSFFYTTCENCELSVVFSEKNDVELHREFLMPSPNAWKFVKIHFEVDSSHIFEAHVRIVPTEVEENPNNFWSIDYFRTCHVEEYRIVSKYSKSELQKCGLIEKNRVVSNTKINYAPPIKTVESKTCFTEHCIPCNLHENQHLFCGKMKICDDSHCYCSSGFRSSDQNDFYCNEECSFGTYGFGCRKECGNCKSNSCDKIDGSCVCNEYFNGTTCKIPLYGVMLKDPPELIETSYDYCTIKLNNTEYFGKFKPKYYLVQYKKNIAQNSDWIDFGPISDIENENSIEIGGLTPNSEYKIRFLASDVLEYVKYLNNARVPFTLCQTKCKLWTEDDVRILYKGDDQITIKLNLTEDKCSINSYEMHLILMKNPFNNNENQTVVSPAKETYDLFNLKPQQFFKVTFISASNQITKEFISLDRVPSPIYNIQAVESDIDNIRLSWNEPKQPNGMILYYDIELRKTRGRLCSEDSKDGATKFNSTTPSFVFQDLSPFSEYLVTISAVNSRFRSSELSQIVNTKSLIDFDEKEGLDQVRVELESILERSVTIKLINFDCKSMKGELILKTVTKCLSSWCRNELKDAENKFSLDRKQLVLTNLNPFTNYSTIFSFCRVENCDYTSTQNYKTSASGPNEVKNLSVVSKGANYIELRWIPPFPPTGTLEKYSMNYESNEYFAKVKTLAFAPKICQIWSEFHCVRLSLGDGYEGYSFKLSLYASNSEVPQTRLVHNVISVETKEQPSKPPYNLRIEWEINNTITLFWNHPNETNGDLNAFLIYLNKNPPLKLPIERKNYKLTYAHKFTTPFQPMETVNIQIVALNKFASFAAILEDYSYPPPPSFVENKRINLLNSSETTATISLDILKPDGAYTSRLILLISDGGHDILFENLRENIGNSLEFSNNFRVLNVINNNELTEGKWSFEIGDNSTILSKKRTIYNPPLREGVKYNLTVVLLNKFKNKYRFDAFSKVIETSGTPAVYDGNTKSSSPNYLLIILLPIIVFILIILSIFIVRKRKLLPSISLERILEVPIRYSAPLRNNNEENVPLESSESIIVKPVIKVKPKISARVSTNPPNSGEIYTRYVKISDFEDYVKESITNGELSRQHGLFPRGQTQPWEYGSLKVNKPKNRYNNLVAYDHSRVKLEKLPGDEYSDYINASYIHGYDVPNSYIATQGPKPSTLNDFWRMIWQENVRHIVMLANLIEGGKKKVEQYWPNINEELEFGGISVEYHSMELFADFEYRIFHVKFGSSKRKIEQLHYTTWPDHGVPLYPRNLVPFLQKILKIPLNSSSPVLVHCSAGVGRTGTILLADISLRMAAKEGAIDMLNIVQKLREQRPNMVDNVEQYKLAHLVVLECLMGLRTSVPCNENMQKIIEKLIEEEEYKSQLEYLDETQWQDDAMKSVAGNVENFVNYPEKNRFQDIVPENYQRIFLKKYPSDDESSSYINAVKVDGFRCPGRYIVTQFPMPNTLSDFWRLVHENHVQAVISLNQIELEDQTCCEFFPTTERPLMEPNDFIQLQLIKIVQLEYYEIISVRLTTPDTSEKLDVEVVSFKKWRSGSNLPDSCEEFLAFWEEAESISRRSDTVVVTCMNGVTASGIYVALSFILEKIKLEQECDVCLALRTVRHNRKNFVRDANQFVFLYEAALKYVNGFQSYANFQNLQT